MRNKLRRSEPITDTACQLIVLSESSCSEDDSSLDPKAKNDSNSAAGLSERKVQPLQEDRKTVCAKGVKIAPIFLRAKKRSGGELPQKSALPPQSDDVQQAKSPPALPRLTVGDKCREQPSPSALHSCLEQIQSSNPAFPVRDVFSTLRKKAREGLQEHEPTEPSSYPYNYLKEKRKRGNEFSERSPKRPRSSLTVEGAAGLSHHHLLKQDAKEGSVHPVEKQPRSSKLSRTHRLKQKSGSQARLDNLNSGWKNYTQSNIQLLKSSHATRSGLCFEDTLWTDKYSPQHSSEVIGNSASVNKLHSWLRKWKLRADRDERRKMEERKREENSNDSWDCGDFQGEAGSDDGGEERLGNAMLIIGPSGVGKTASVYACAQELGFKVFEVNCSSQRSGRHVLSQLKEVTQSHLVETSGKDSLKPAYFNNFNSSNCTSKSETLPGKTVLPKIATFTSKRRRAQNLSCSRRRVNAKPAAVTLANYFKMKAKADHLQSGGLSPCEKPDSKKLVNSPSGSDETVPQDKRTATSLILFEEVDIIFDDDIGFLSAIKTFMTTTKRPVILTTNDPLFKDKFDGSLDEIIFKTPSVVSTCSYLQLLCLAESVQLDLDDVRSLLKLTCGDIRRCLLQLQLWVHSNRRWQSQCGGLPKKPICVQYSNAAEEESLLSLPQYNMSCSANMLGLSGVTPHHLLNLLKPWSKKHMNELLMLLTESWRRGMPLLYSNLELLLSTAAQAASVHCPEKVTYSKLKSDPSGTDVQIQLQNRSISAKTSVTNSKSVRNTSRLSRRKYNTVVSNISSCSLTHKPQKTSFSFSGTPSRVVSSSDKAEQTAAKEESDCLLALTDFFDLMSYLDATLTPISDFCTAEAFVWTGAEIKDGLLDEMREEKGSSWSQERLLDIQAVVESLGCHRCWQRVSVVWTERVRQTSEDKKCERLVERLALTSKRRSLSFSVQPLCESSVSQRRYMLSRMVLSSKPFRLLGNRRAVCVDYLPVLRSICRSHKAQQREPVRCLNYLNSNHLGLSKSTVQLLAEDFT